MGSRFLLLFDSVDQVHNPLNLPDLSSFLLPALPITSYWAKQHISKLGGAGDGFGDDLCVDYANLPCASGRNQFTNTKFTRPNAQISKSTCAHSACSISIQLKHWQGNYTSLPQVRQRPRHWGPRRPQRRSPLLAGHRPQPDLSGRQFNRTKKSPQN